MNPELLRIAAIERQRYLEFFIQETNLLKAGKHTCATELQVELSNAIAYPYNIIFLDFIYKDEKDDDQITELRLDEILDYPPEVFKLDNLTLTVTPFCWNSCELITNAPDISFLPDWLEKWLKIGEDIPDTELAGVLHSCSEPKNINGNFLLIIDFGSAPEECFAELMQLLADYGATETRVATTEI